MHLVADKIVKLLLMDYLNNRQVDWLLELALRDTEFVHIAVNFGVMLCKVT